MYSHTNFNAHPFAIAPGEISWQGLFRNLPEHEQSRKLYYRGNIELLRAPWVGFTGTESPTIEGTGAATSLATAIIDLGYVPVSGGCPGIDSAVHQAAVDLNKPTVVIMPHSLLEEFFYVGKYTHTTNTQLYHDVIDAGGLLLSEYNLGGFNAPPNKHWYSHCALERNRLIAASLALIAVQWENQRSGTRATINRATKFGRDVWVPQPRSHDSKYNGTWEYIEDPDTKKTVLTRSTQEWMAARLGVLHKEAQLMGFCAR